MIDTESHKIDPADGERFAQDLKQIREQKGVSLDDLHELTKIPLSILGDFEVNGLLGNPLFNQVYLRSLVRTYAQSTGIDATRALECLESATIGMYHGELGKEYLPVAAETKRSKSTRKQKSGDNVSADKKAEKKAEEEVDKAIVSKNAAGENASVVRGISSITVAPSSASSSAVVGSGSSGVVLPRSSVFTIVSSVVVVALLLVFSFFLWQTFTGPKSTAQQDTTKVATAEQVLSPQESTAVAAPVISPPELGDRIEVSVAASGGSLRPIRIRVDRDLRRPYWIDKDSVRTFEFRDQIVLEENIELISLSIDGFDYPLGLRPGKRVVISRSNVEAFFETLPSR